MRVGGCEYDVGVTLAPMLVRCAWVGPGCVCGVGVNVGVGVGVGVNVGVGVTWVPVVMWGAWVGLDVDVGVLWMRCGCVWVRLDVHAHVHVGVLWVHMGAVELLGAGRWFNKRGSGR